MHWLKFIYYYAYTDELKDISDWWEKYVDPRSNIYVKNKIVLLLLALRKWLKENQDTKWVRNLFTRFKFDFF